MELRISKTSLLFLFCAKGEKRPRGYDEPFTRAGYPPLARVSMPTTTFRVVAFQNSA